MNLARDHSITTLTILGLTWSDGLSNGGQPILDYQVSFDQGTGDWIILQSGVTTKSFTYNGATPVLTYKFRVKARNIIGFSVSSAEFAIRAAIVPAAPTQVTTTRNINQVIIAWTSPSTNPVQDYGAPITGYQVFIQTSNPAVYA